MASMPEDSNIDEDKDEDDKEDKDEDDKEDNNEDDKGDDNDGFFTVASREDVGKEKCRTLRLVCPVTVCQ